MKTYKDGTIEYYREVKSHIGASHRVLDFGSGRGSW